MIWPVLRDTGNVMLKKDIKKTIEKHITKTLQKDEVWHSTYEPDNPHSASDNVTGLDLCLSDVQWAIGTNDFQGFEEQIQSFIKTELAQHSLPNTSPVYRYLAREYLKAEAHCIRVSINRARGDYSDETQFEWMPTHLGELDKISRSLDGPPLIKKQGRPSEYWGYIRDELNKSHESSSIEGKSRAQICRILADHYNKKFPTAIQPDSIRKTLKTNFDKLGY